jgi:hypothetical protein
MVSISSSNPPQKTVTSIASTTNVTKALTFKKETMAKRIAHPLSFHHVTSSSQTLHRSYLRELYHLLVP